MPSPIIHREFVAIVQSPRTFVMQLCLILVLTLTVLVRWPNDSLVDVASSQSIDVFRLFGYGMMTLLLLIIPAFPAVSIVKEKRQGTLALLLNSPLKPWSIYLGKLGGTMLFVIWLLTLTGPAVAACYLMGGISITDDIVRLYLAALIMGVQVTTLALWISTLSATIDGALRSTYAMVLALAVLSLLPYGLFQGQTGWLSTLSDHLRCISPIAATMELLGHGDLGSQGFSRTENVFPRFILYASLMSIAAAAATIFRLNHRLFDQSRSQGQITDERSAGGRFLRRALFIIDPQRRFRGIPLLVNPVLVKEFQTRRFGRMHWLLRLVGFTAVASVFLTYVLTRETVSWGVETDRFGQVGGILVVLQVALILLFMPAIASGLFSTEFESGGWTMLQMTPLTVGRIVSGKLFSALLPAMLILCGTLPGYLTLIIIKENPQSIEVDRGDYPPTASGSLEYYKESVTQYADFVSTVVREPTMGFEEKRVLVSLLFATLVVVMVSAAISSLMKRTATSTAVCYGTLLIFLIVPFLIWMGRDAPFSRESVKLALMPNPVAAALSDMNTPGFDFALTPHTWWICGLICAAALVTLVVRVNMVSRPR